MNAFRRDGAAAPARSPSRGPCAIAPPDLVAALPWVATALLLACGRASGSEAETPAPRHGDHPAVVVQRLARAAGYDWAAHLYPHPALPARRADDAPAEPPADAPAAAAPPAAARAASAAGQR